MPENKGILSGIRTSLQKLLNFQSGKKNQSKAFDIRKRTLDISTFDNNSSRQYSRSFSLERFDFSRIFEIQKDRISRYNELETIYKMIPECQKAISLITDDIITPALNKKDNELNIDPIFGDVGLRGAEYAGIILDQTDFLQKILPNTVFSMGLYGDAFLEEKIYEGMLRFVLLDCKRCTLIYDKDLDLELGLAYQLEVEDKRHPIKEWLSQIYPVIRINLARNKNVAITSSKRGVGNNKNNITDINNNSEIIVNHEEIEKVLFDITKELGGQYRYIPPGKYTHFRISHNNLYFPYGTSLLDGSRAIAKQLLLAEQAMTIARITRAPSRKLFTVDATGIPSDEVPQFMSQVQSSIAKERVVDGTQLDLISDAAIYIEDYWSPSIENTPQLTIDSIPGEPIEDKIGDVEYLRDKLAGSLDVPKAYLGNEADTGTRALLTLEDIVYSRKILKLQSDVNLGINGTINNCFNLINVKQLEDSVEISLPKPQNIEDNIRLENISSRIDLAGKLLEFLPNMSKKYIMHNILDFNEDDLKDMEREKLEESKYRLFDSEGEEDMGSFGGEPDFDGGSGMDDMGEFGGEEIGGMDDEFTPEEDFGSEDTGTTEDFDTSGATEPMDEEI